MDGVQPEDSQDKRMGIAQEDRETVKETQDRLTRKYKLFIIRPVVKRGMF